MLCGFHWKTATKPNEMSRLSKAAYERRRLNDSPDDVTIEAAMSLGRS
jgi:hypothetical protein